jgi:membrane-associated phospholipid phosphatase
MTDREPATRTAPSRRPLLLTHGIWHPRSLVRFAAAGAVIVTMWTLVGMLLVSTGAPALDREVLGTAVGLQDPATVEIARFVSWVGDFLVVGTVALAVAAYAYARSRRWDLGWLTLAVIGGALAITAAIKLLTDRMRPDGGLTDTFSSAFPSGHAVRAAAVYTLVAWLVLRWTSPHRRTTRVLVVAVAVAMILAIGTSRLLLGAHWLTDVVGGYVLGVLWVAVCVVVTQPHRAPRAAVASDAIDGAVVDVPDSGAGVDHQGQHRADTVAPSQQPRSDGEGPTRAPDVVDEQRRPSR